jgi:hypothetical protein
MAADQIFIGLIVLVCVIIVGWMSIDSHRADARRREQASSQEANPPAPSGSRKAHE